MSSSDCLATMIAVSRSKYSSAFLPLTVNEPEPGESQTRAIAVLRLPVEYVRVEVLIGRSLSQTVIKSTTWQTVNHTAIGNRRTKIIRNIYTCGEDVGGAFDVIVTDFAPATA